MKRTLQAALVSAAVIASLSVAMARDDDHDERDERGNSTVTLAVFGDWPYSQTLLNNAHLLVNSVNNDKAVEAVVHVGDIHSGSMPCTSAFITFDYVTKTGAPIPASNPGWNQHIYYQFQQFNAPVIYTPGDNEWADCHKPKQFSSGAPLKELASVRELFFAHPGETLGKNPRHVISQAQAFDPAHPEDSQFVENVLWNDSRVVFVTLNMPGGSNNDSDGWSAPFSDPSAQAQEALQRTAADLRWLEKAFKQAAAKHARGVVVALQADMWDLEGGAAHLSNYQTFVQKLADLSVQFGRPVLLLNGDSHTFKVDHPLANPADAQGLIHHTQAVPNLTRIVVEGSGVGTHWLRLTIDPSSGAVFSWSNVAY